MIPTEVDRDCAGVVAEFKSGEPPYDEVGASDAAKDDQGAEGEKSPLPVRVLRQWLAGQGGMLGGGGYKPFYNVVYGDY